MASIVKSIYGKNKKALALDLDNTLWGNVISEDGLDGIEIGPETPMGEIYLNFQKYLKKLKSLGIILNVVSKNDMDIALEGIEKSDGVLKKEDFIKIKANWEPKSENIKNLSKELSLGVDAFAFIDDNLMERDIVQQNVPGVAVPEIGSVEKYIDVIDKSEFFEVTNITREDLEKTKQYKENALREESKSKFENYNDYLMSLDMKAEIKPFESKYYDRISQLSNKSNQFNLTTKRYTVEDIKSVAESDDYITLYGKLIDKFGDNGIVSLLIAHIIEPETICEIDLFLMSCRVLKRDMEFAMMDELVRICKEKGITCIKGSYLKTEKNSMVKDMYESFGFAKVLEDVSGNKYYELGDLQNYQIKCNVIKNF